MKIFSFLILMVFCFFFLTGCEPIYEYKKEKFKIKRMHPQLECINDQVWVVGPVPFSQYLDIHGKPYTCSRFCIDNPEACNHE